MAGDPDLEASYAALCALRDNGADIIELGAPFTDPMADGAAIQKAGLRALANTIRRQLRSSDVVARFGGEEFVILMPETDPADAVEKLEAIRLAVANTIVQLPRQTTAVTLTVSIGVGMLGPDGDDPHALLDAADARLFQAKQGGRNRVVGPPGMPTPTGVLRQSPAA